MPDASISSSGWLGVPLWLGAGFAVVASAAPPSDSIYIHCRDAGGDFRISELNHTVSQFSDKYQEYRPVCRTCDIVEWGDKITMRDGSRISVQVNRLTGEVLIQRNDTKSEANSTQVRSYQGTCVKGSRVVPKAAPAPIARAF